MSTSSRMGACADSPNSQPWVSVEEGSHALHLLIEVAALGVSELIERLHGNIKPATRALLVPDSGGDAIDEEYRVISRL